MNSTSKTRVYVAGVFKTIFIKTPCRPFTTTLVRRECFVPSRCIRFCGQSLACVQKPYLIDDNAFKLSGYSNISTKFSREKFHWSISQSPFVTGRFLSTSVKGDILPATAKVMAEHGDFKVRYADKHRKRSGTLVVFFGFYGASERAIQGYCDIYHRYGFDVLYVKSYLKQFAWPKNSQTLAQVLLNHMKSDLSGYENYVIHAMSMGAYNFTVVMGEFYDKPETYGEVERKIQAIVYDSIVIGSLKNMSIGVGRGASKNPIIQRLIPLTMSAYLNSTYPFTVRVFNHYINLFKEQSLKKPTLVFYSRNDPMADCKVLGELVTQWRNKFAFHIEDKFWEKSKHAGHVFVHRDEYLSTLDQFLSKVPKFEQMKSKL